MDDPADPSVNGEFEDFQALLRLAGQGSEDAFGELLRRYKEDMHRAVRRVRDQRLRAKHDSIDTVHSAWRSLWRRRADLAERFDDPEQFLRYLIGMAENKEREEARKLLERKKRDARREVPLENAGEALVGREPSPEEEAMAREELERLLKGQPERRRQIIRLKLEGHSYVEIARQLDMDPQTARRFLQKVAQATPK